MPADFDLGMPKHLILAQFPSTSRSQEKDAGPMSRSLPSARGWFGWMLVLGCGLAAGLPAWGQSAASPESSYREAIQVKLAWLADRETFACILGVHPAEGGLEACGRVPNEKVHRRALALARAHSALPIVDKLDVNPQ